MKKFVILNVTMVLLTFAIIGCKEDDNSNPVNPTNGKTTAIFNTTVTYGNLLDQDANAYKTVRIGTQTWMAENLRTTKYNDGTPIPIVTDANDWAALLTGAFCYYDNTTSLDSIATYGCMYNWYAVNTGKLAPKGWHVATTDEWTILTTTLGGGSEVGGQLKEAGTLHWNSPNTEANNLSGFTALPAGNRFFDDGHFEGIGYYGLWWSATESSNLTAWDRVTFYNSIDINGYSGGHKPSGFSVRCVKD